METKKGVNSATKLEVVVIKLIFGIPSSKTCDFETRV